MKIDVKSCLEMLGMPVREKITGVKGVVASVCFDLYGCTQVLLNPGVGSDGKLLESYWFDISRIEVFPQGKRVMPLPDFCLEKGPETKPTKH